GRRGKKNAGPPATHARRAGRRAACRTATITGSWQAYDLLSHARTQVMPDLYGFLRSAAFRVSTGQAERREIAPFRTCGRDRGRLGSPALRGLVPLSRGAVAANRQFHWW